MSSNNAVPPRPDRLYKYCPPERIDILENGQIRFSPVSDLNDPFEALPDSALLDDPSFRGDILQSVCDDSVRFDAEMGAKHPNWKHTSPAEIRKLMEDKIASVRIDFGQTAVQSFQKATAPMRMLCLSAVSPESTEALLLWAHYTSGHKGYVLEFDATHPWFQLKEHSDPTAPDYGIADWVDYRTRRVSWTANGPQKEFVLGKSKDWAYEQEYRLIKLSSCKSLSSKGLTPYPPEAVVSVTIGCSATGDSIVEATRRNASLRHVIFRHAKIHPDEYRVFLE